MIDLTPARITDPEQYQHALARRELVAAPLRDADKLRPGMLPARERVELERFLARLTAQITEYEQERARENRFGVAR